MPEERKHLTCPHCSNQTILVVQAEYNQQHYTLDSFPDTEIHTDWSILKCETCDEISVYRSRYLLRVDDDEYADFNHKFLYPIDRPELPNLPVKIEKAYKAALKVQKIEPNACA